MYKLEDNYIILCSNSLRRKELLKKMNISFEVRSPCFEETLKSFEIFSYDKVENQAKQKALSILNTESENLSKFNLDNKRKVVLSADTVVVCDNKILLKPGDRNQAFLMLKMLSNRVHFVVTSVCLAQKVSGKTFIFSDTTFVTFKSLSDKMILDYIRTGSPFDKAGAYGIQDCIEFVESIVGDFYNVVGLPVVKLEKYLKDEALFK